MGAAMLWVLFFHTWGLKIGFLPLNILRGTGFGGVDICLLLSGLGLAMSLSAREQRYGGFLARRAGRVLPAYFLVMVPYTLFLIWRGEAEVSTLLWNAALLSYWVKAPGAFNWYVPAIMLFYALTPWWFRLLKRSRRPAWLTAGAAAAGVLLAQVLLRGGCWDYMDVLFRLPIFALGLLMGLWAWEDRPLKGRDLAFWAVCLGLGAVYGALVLGLGDRAAFWPQPYVFLLAAVPLCLLLCWCFARLPLGGLGKLLRLLGDASLEIYLLNVTLFASAAPAAQEWLLPLALPGGMALYYLVTIPVNLALGVLFHRGMERGRRALAARRKTGEKTAVK